MYVCVCERERKKDSSLSVLMKRYNLAITTRGACLSRPSRFPSRSIRQARLHSQTDISVTDKSACLREFYCCTAAVRVYKSHVCARLSHFDREARPLATSKNVPMPLINSTSTCAADSFRFRVSISISPYRHVLRAYREYFSARKRWRDGQG